MNTLTMEVRVRPLCVPLHELGNCSTCALQGHLHAINQSVSAFTPTKRPRQGQRDNSAAQANRHRKQDHCDPERCGHSAARHDVLMAHVIHAIAVRAHPLCAHSKHTGQSEHRQQQRGHRDATMSGGPDNRHRPHHKRGRDALSSRTCCWDASACTPSAKRCIRLAWNTGPAWFSSSCSFECFPRGRGGGWSMRTSGTGPAGRSTRHRSTQGW